MALADTPIMPALRPSAVGALPAECTPEPSLNERAGTRRPGRLPPSYLGLPSAPSRWSRNAPDRLGRRGAGLSPNAREYQPGASPQCAGRGCSRSRAHGPCRMPTLPLRTAGRARRVVALPRWLEASCPSTLGKPAGHRTEPRPSRSTSDSWSAVRSSVRSKLCERRSTAVNRGHSETAEIAACGQQRSTAVTPGYPWGVNYGSEGWGFDSLRAR
jgi:hypothetical protein